MTPETLLTSLAALNVTVTAAGDRLRVEAPAGVLTADLRAALAEHKQALLDLLAQRDSEPERLRIPLTLDEPPSAWLAKRGLRIVGGDPATGTLFVARP